VENRGERITHVLVVDDEPERLRSTLAKHTGVRSDGTTVSWEGEELSFTFIETLEGGRDSVRFEPTRVNVVLLDVRFPGRDEGGFDLLDEIKAMTPDLPVLMLTAHPGSAAAFRAGRQSADAFLDKAQFLDPSEPALLNELFKTVVYVRRRMAGQPELHDRGHERTADEFAAEYDGVEQSYPATVSYYLYENAEIASLVRSTVEQAGSASICDIGCGTGRIEELLDREFDWSKVSVRSVDFSPQMLRALRSKAIRAEDDSFRLHRGSAERLSMFADASFDVVLMAFGVPSYTRYFYSIAEAGRLCKPGGYALFSVYNEDSVVFDARRSSWWSDQEAPIAAIPDPETGTLRVGDRNLFASEVFSVRSLSRLITRFGFRLDHWSTFPTLYAATPRSAARRMPDAGAPVVGFPHAQDFSYVLHELDVIHSQTNPGKGHYLVMVGQKPTA
jgi:ubiquinone/menaquinone biosynthesis C-methylase UbiE/CheY-like chemotaxis protein